LTKP